MKTKVFWNGDTQVIRLPKELHLDDKEVEVRKEGNRIIVEPVAPTWDWLQEYIDNPVDDSFIQALQEPEGELREHSRILNGRTQTRIVGANRSFPILLGGCTDLVEGPFRIALRKGCFL